MLLLHGIGHRWQVWSPVLDSLARDFDVVALDLPGFGESPRLPGSDQSSVDAATDRLCEVMDDLGWRRAHLVGNSLGGWLALELGLRGRALSICGFAPAGLWSDPARMERRLRLWFALWVGGSRRLGPILGLLRWRSVRAVTLFGLFGRPWRIPPDIAIGDARSLAASAFDETFKDGIDHDSRFTGGRSLDVPVTVAWTSRDPLFRAGSCTVAELPPHTHVPVLQGCGHVPTWDDPPLVLETIRSTVAGA